MEGDKEGGIERGIEEGTEGRKEGETKGEIVRVPDRRRPIIPEVVLVRRWVMGFWEFGGGRV